MSVSDTEPLEYLQGSIADVVEEALRDDETEGMTLPDLGEYVARRIVGEGQVVHLDACPGCGTPDTHHVLDAPPICPCGVERERWTASAFVGGYR